MAQRGDIQINNFVRGLVTEASPLTFPPGASLDEVNFVLKRDGTRERRLGLDLEDNYGLHDLGLSSAVLEGARCQAYRWSIPNGDIEQDIGVIQTGNRIWFIDLYTQNPSANILNGGSAISVPEITNDALMTFTTINNYLVGITNGLPQPYLFNYDASTDAITIETAPIVVRDLWGVNDSLDVNGRPSSLSAAHHYNLLNQGWLTSIQSTCGAGINAIDCTYNTFGIYPSNSDQWSLGRIEDLTSADVKKFDPNIAARNLVSTGQAPRGHFIINLYSRGESRNNQTGLTLPVDRETGRITAIAAYSGRIFYGGILSSVVGGDNRSPNLSGTVLFSQLFENKINLVKCYQEADPTSPDINDIVDTDGGLIQIPECSYIFALKAIRESLFVFAANGVWEIRGGDNGFTATSYMVNKISNVGVYAPKSIVEVEGTIYFWAATGIHAIGRNENGVFQTTNLTLPTIQTLYNAIPDASKKNARGYHDLSQNRARWLYYSPETKEFGEAIDIDSVPLVTLTELGTLTATGVTGGNEPEVARINSTTAVVLYGLTSPSTKVYYRVLTVAADLSVTVGAQTELADFGANSAVGYAVIALSDNKVLAAYRGATLDTFCVVGTYSGSTLTWGTPVAVNSVFNPTLQTSQLHLAKISSGRVVLATKHSTANEPTVQVIDIDSSNNITFGIVAKDSATNVTYVNVTMLTSTSGVLCWNSGNRCRMKHFSISGTTITLNGTSYEFPNASQFATASNYGISNVDIQATGTTTLFAIGEGFTVVGATTTYAPIAFTVTEASGVLTSTAALLETDHNNGVSQSTSGYYGTIYKNNKVITLQYVPNPRTYYLTKYTKADPPVRSRDDLLATTVAPKVYTHPEIVHMDGDLYLSVVWTGTSTRTIESLAFTMV